MSKDDAWARILSAVQRIESAAGNTALRRTAADGAADQQRIAALESELAQLKAATPVSEESRTAELQADNEKLTAEVSRLENALAQTDAAGAELERLRLENDRLVSDLAIAEERYRNAKSAAAQIAARVDRAIDRLDSAMKE